MRSRYWTRKIYCSWAHIGLPVPFSFRICITRMKFKFKNLVRCGHFIIFLRGFTKMRVIWNFYPERQDLQVSANALQLDPGRNNSSKDFTNTLIVTIFGFKPRPPRRTTKAVVWYNCKFSLFASFRTKRRLEIIPPIGSSDRT